MVAAKPYVVEVEEVGCEQCGLGQSWRIYECLGPAQEEALDNVYTDLSEANLFATQLNRAFAEGEARWHRKAIYLDDVCRQVEGAMVTGCLPAALLQRLRIAIGKEP